jgi:hypothetical protein
MISYDSKVISGAMPSLSDEQLSCTDRGVLHSEEQANLGKFEQLAGFLGTPVKVKFHYRDEPEEALTRSGIVLELNGSEPARKVVLFDPVKNRETRLTETNHDIDSCQPTALPFQYRKDETKNFESRLPNRPGVSDIELKLFLSCFGVQTQLDVVYENPRDGNKDTSITGSFIGVVIDSQNTYIQIETDEGIESLSFGKIKSATPKSIKVVD